MRIGISLFNLHRSMAGLYQFALTFAQALMNHWNSAQYVIFYDSSDFSLSDFPNSGQTTFRFVENVDRRLYRLRGLLRLAAILGCRWVDIPFMRGKYDALRRANLDLLVQPAPGAGAFFSGVPYISQLFDLAYRDAPENFTATGRWLLERRDVAMVRGALAVIVDSQHLKERLAHLCGVPGDRIEVLSFRAPGYVHTAPDQDQLLQVRQKYGLPERYIFCPSRLSVHKNHLGLLKAIRSLKETESLIVPLVLVGPKGEMFDAIMDFVRRNDLEGQVHYLGYVPDEDMASFYNLATALVFPTFLGPTCIPVVEAFALGCPVICSDLPGYRQQIADAGLLVDPHQPSGIARAIHRLWTDQELRDVLRQRGLECSAMLHDRDYGEEIAEIIRRALDGASLGGPEKGTSYAQGQHRHTIS